MAAIVWRKSAIRDVRPFFETATLETCLAGAEIKLSEDRPFTADAAFTIEQHDLAKLAITIKPNLSAESLVSGAVERGDLALAVTALQPFLKKTYVVKTMPAGSAVGELIEIGPEVLEELGGGGNIVVEVALCLRTTLPKTPGSPFLLGHWLSKKSFSIKLPKPAEDFDIKETTDEEWVKMGYPAKTLYLVECSGSFNEPAAKDEKVATVRVHSDIYRKLTLESQQKLAKPIMTFMAAEIAANVVAIGMQDCEGDDQVVANSPLAAFLKRIDKVEKCSFEQLKAYVKQPGMPKLKALIQADQQSVRSIAEA